MSLMRIAHDHGTLRTDNMWRAIATAPYRFSFVKFNDLTIINIRAKKLAR